MKPKHWRKIVRALGLDSRGALDIDYVRGGNPENRGQFSKGAGGGKGRSGGAGGALDPGPISGSPPIKPKTQAPKPVTTKKAADPSATLKSMSLTGMKDSLGAAVSEFKLPHGYLPPKPTDRPEVTGLINELCEKFGLEVHEDGSIRKARNGSAGAQDRDYVRGGNPENKGQFSKGSGSGGGKSGSASASKTKEAAPAKAKEAPKKGASAAPAKPTTKTPPIPKSFSYAPIDTIHGLSPEDAKVDQKARAKLEANREGMLKEYNEKFGKVSNADLARRMFRDCGYNGRNSAAVHEPSSALAKDAWKHNLTSNPEQNAVLFAGISGAGKSSSNGVVPDVENKAAAILDGNLSSLKKARQRVAEVVDAGKKPRVVFVWRDPVDAWVNGVISRMKNNKEEGGRVVPMSTVLENGPGSLNTVRGLLSDGLQYGDHIFVVDNSLGRNNAKLMDRKKFESLSYPDNLREILTAKTKELYDAGHVTKEQYEALIK